MKKILVVLTGGTIGSKVENSVINVSDKSPWLLLAMYKEHYGERECFEVIQPLNILSENMTPQELLVLCRALSKVRYEEYDGVIITHGSDTISYTSAFIGMLFHYAPVPIILVASNYPLGQEGSNGLSNFARAVEFIRHRVVRGVFTIYRDGNGESQVYLSTRVVEAEPFLDQFRDFSGCSFGKMKDGRFIANPGCCQPAIEEVEGKKEQCLQVPEDFRRSIMVIRPYPGMDYSRFCLEKKPAAVLHYLYHSATACLQGEEYNLLPFVKRCKQQGIDFYTASYKKTEGSMYATGDMLLKAGVTPLVNISLEAAYAKLMLLYNQKEPVVKERISQNLYFECIERRNA